MSRYMILLNQKNNQVKVEEILVNKFDLLRSAYKDLRKNKIRSALTTLGIIIGVSSVISISGLSASAAEVVKGKLFSYGKNAVRFYQGDDQWATETDLINLKQQNPNIKYIDHISNEKLYQLYKVCKVSVLPSWFETPGLVSLEAAVMGCNIVVSSKGTTKAYFGDYAYYCNVMDSESIRKELDKAYNDPYRKEFRMKILRQYTWKAAAEATERGYRIALKK